MVTNRKIRESVLQQQDMLVCKKTDFADEALVTGSWLLLAGLQLAFLGEKWRCCDCCITLAPLLFAWLHAWALLPPFHALSRLYRWAIEIYSLLFWVHNWTERQPNSAFVLRVLCISPTEKMPLSSRFCLSDILHFPTRPFLTLLSGGPEPKKQRREEPQE